MMALSTNLCYIGILENLPQKAEHLYSEITINYILA